jgi:hypothetical protein
MGSGYGEMGDGKKPKRKKRILRTLKVNELSGVDKAAQRPAEAVLMKRDSEIKPEEAQKFHGYERPLLTTANDGHTHLLDDCGQGGETTYSRASGGEYGHTHPWVRRLDGNIEIGEAEGHTHSLDPDPNEVKTARGVPAGDGQPNDGEPEMTKQSDEPTATGDNEAVQKSIQELTSRAERAEAILKLDTDSRRYFDGLDSKAQDAFLTKSETARHKEIAEAQKADKVVYKSESGAEFRASDDPRLVEMAKRADEETRKRRESDERLEKAELEKRAESELGNCPGTVAVRGQILKALKGVEGADEFLKAANEALSGAFVTKGSKDGTVAKGEDRLEQLAKAHAEANKVSIEVARAAVLETPEGSAIYAELAG